MEKRGLLIVVSGFAGSGKGTLMKRLMGDYENYALSVSMTTRDPRPGEVHGREYFFVSKEEFEQKIHEGGLIEYASYVEHYYGTPKDYVEEQMAAGKDVILEIEIQGALKVKERFPDAVLIFVLPPSIEELYRRLKTRGTETEDVIRKRMGRAAEEVCAIDKYDYIMINDEVEKSVKRLHGIIEAAHYTPGRNEEFIQTIKNGLTIKDVLEKL
ncbi:MAG: guanylate kinase [Lachnospiraceae bacterium]|nr:guanylate kinase [Lachnospiraceae bacterium]